MKGSYQIKAQKDSAEIWIYEDIGEGWLGGLSAKVFADDLKKVGKVKNIYVRINSVGGSAVDGTAIYNSLKRHPANINVSIDGIAASIASIIAMAGDHIEMASNAMMMIHEPWIVAGGTASELREQADVLDKFNENLINTYQGKSNLDRESLSDLMKAETWMTADEALDHGFIDEITNNEAIAASCDKSIIERFKHSPETLSNLIQEKEPDLRAKNKQRLADYQKFYRERNW